MGDPIKKIIIKAINAELEKLDFSNLEFVYYLVKDLR